MNTHSWMLVAPTGAPASLTDLVNGDISSEPARLRPPWPDIPTSRCPRVRVRLAGRHLVLRPRVERSTIDRFGFRVRASHETSQATAVSRNDSSETVVHASSVASAFRFTPVSWLPPIRTEETEPTDLPAKAESYGVESESQTHSKPNPVRHSGIGIVLRLNHVEACFRPELEALANLERDPAAEVIAEVGAVALGAQVVELVDPE